MLCDEVDQVRINGDESIMIDLPSPTAGHIPTPRTEEHEPRNMNTMAMRYADFLSIYASNVDSFCMGYRTNSERAVQLAIA